MKTPARALVTTHDARVLRGKFKPSQAAERDFFKALKSVAREVGKIVDSHVEGAELRAPASMQKKLEAYSKKLEPWAFEQSAQLLKRVARSNRLAYQNKSKAIGRELYSRAAEDDVKRVLQALLNEQVTLIKSIPIEAGLRAQKIAFDATVAGTRAAPDKDTVEELKRQLGCTTEVAESRAQLIAVTETARSNASINQARAIAVGAKGYIWHATLDEATRASHRQMDGKYILYSKPPRLSDGTIGHAGTFPRCRCFGEPVFDD